MVPVAAAPTPTPDTAPTAWRRVRVVVQTASVAAPMVNATAALTAHAAAPTAAAIAQTVRATAPRTVRVDAAVAVQRVLASTVTQPRARKPSVVVVRDAPRAPQASPAVAVAHTAKSNSVGRLAPKGAIPSPCTRAI